MVRNDHAWIRPKLVDPGDAGRAQFVHRRRHGHEARDSRANNVTANRFWAPHATSFRDSRRPSVRARDPRSGRGIAAMTDVGEHAIVLGASLAGLAAAAALADRFHRVTIVDRDVLPQSGEQRDGVPQGRHAHLLLPAGGAALSELLPGVADDLRRRDAHFIDATEFRFRIAGGCLLSDDPGLEILGATRPLLESIVRERVQDLAGVRFREEQDAVELLTTPDRSRVTGVRLRSRASNAEHTVAGDLVVDATGRNSHTPRWMTDLGYEAPERGATPRGGALHHPPVSTTARGPRRLSTCRGDHPSRRAPRRIGAGRRGRQVARDPRRRPGRASTSRSRRVRRLRTHAVGE